MQLFSGFNQDFTFTGLRGVKISGMKSEKGKTCAVIGAGIGGLAVSIRLAHAGFRVVLFEANDEPGGNITEIRKDGFRFDAGPSILTKPEYIDELFLLAGKDPRKSINYEQVEPIFRYFFPGGGHIDLFSDREKFRKELESKTDEPFESVEELLDDAKEIFRLTQEVFLERSLHQAKNYFNLPTIRGILNFKKVRAFQSMHAYNRKKFKDERLVHLFNRFAGFNGSSPYEAPATLNVITHFAVNSGSFLPVGGMHTITKSLVRLAKDLGVEIRTSRPVTKIRVTNNKVEGVETGDFFRADVVVSNADIQYTYDKLMPGIALPSVIGRQPRSSSVIVFYWGIKKIFPQLELHNTFFGKDDKEEYDAVFGRKTVCEDPSVYLYQSSLKNKEDAPAGMSNWFVMVTAPYDSGQDWEGIMRETKEKVLRKLSGVLNEDIAPLIVTEEALSPPGIERKTNALHGSIYGNSSNGILSAFLRHANFSRRFKGLYFCGGSVHPGAGIPLCLLSAKITAGLIAKKEI